MILVDELEHTLKRLKKFKPQREGERRVMAISSTVARLNITEEQLDLFPPVQLEVEAVSFRLGNTTWLEWKFIAIHT